MTASRQTVAQTLADVIAWRPVLKPVLRAFEPLLSAQEELVKELADSGHLSDPALLELSVEYARQGVSLLAGKKFTGMAEPLRISAEKLLPLMEAMDVLKPHMPALRAYFLQPVAAMPPSTPPSAPAAEDSPVDSRENLAEAIATGNCETVVYIAGTHKIDPQILDFVSYFVVSSVLRAMVAQPRFSESQEPWDEGNLWQQGYCPVCGALPTLSWLDKPELDEKNAFLSGGGGKKHLHCGQCGANWKFRRGLCPSCGQEGNGVIEILRESGISRGERLEWCTRCKTYCPAVDLRERELVPNLDAAAIGMVHLDMVAARKKLRPLRPSFWNMF